MASEVPGSRFPVPGSASGITSFGLVTPEDIVAAAAALDGVIVRTPLVEAPWLDAFGADGSPRSRPPSAGRQGEPGTGNWEPRAAKPTEVGEGDGSGRVGSPPGTDIRLKCENFQRAGAFKVRGAYTLLARLSADERRRGVIAYSSGNHAQGVALAAQLFGVPAVVVMPTTASEVKRAGAARLGAEVILEGTTSVERKQRAEQIAAERGLVIVPAFDHPDIIAGQGTVGKEVLDDWPDVQAILVPIGGGGLVSGVAAWVKRVKPECLVIGVEPDHADAMMQSRTAGEPITIASRATIADGLAPVRPGDLTFLHTRELVDEIVRVSEDAILDATRRLITSGKLVVEFSGAATTAALLSGAFRPAGRRCVAIVSGGNIDAARVLTLLAEGASGEAGVAAESLPGASDATA